MDFSARSLFIKQTAARLGFTFCGIARAEPLDEDARRLEAWLNKGMQGNMHYMERNFELRVNPYKLVPGARSVISLLINYYPPAHQPDGQPKISRYAYGKDYHEVIRPKLNDFLLEIREKLGDIHGRGFVDSAPVLEKSWAMRSGLGWIGKNGNLIHKQAGSFFFIASLIVDIDLHYDDPYAYDYCGTCRKCIEACPTQAISENKVVDGSKCISYFTIELKDQLIPEKMKGQFHDWIFGCDTCQDVCPWNRFSQPHENPAFHPIPEVLDYKESDWEALTEESFQKIFSQSPIKRTGFKGIKRNLHFRKTNNGQH